MRSYVFVLNGIIIIIAPPDRSRQECGVKLRSDVLPDTYGASAQNETSSQKESSSKKGAPLSLHTRVRARRKKIPKRHTVIESMKNYRHEKAAYDTMSKERSKVEMPEMPLNKMFFISGNNTGTGILQNIIDSDSTGLICESEADTDTSHTRVRVRVCEEGDAPLHLAPFRHGVNLYTVSVNLYTSPVGTDYKNEFIPPTDTNNLPQLAAKQ